MGLRSISLLFEPTTPALERQGSTATHAGRGYHISYHAEINPLVPEPYQFGTEFVPSVTAITNCVDHCWYLECHCTTYHRVDLVHKVEAKVLSQKTWCTELLRIS